MLHTLEETVSSFKSEETETSWNKPEDDAYLDYVPQSDGNLSDYQSDDTVDSKDYDKLDHHSRLTNRTSMAQKEKDKSEDLLCEENSGVPTSNVSEHFRDYCLFCSKPVFQKARHLTRFQSDDVEVEVVFQCPLHLSVGQQIWKNDKNVLKTGEEELVVQVIPNKPKRSAAQGHCVYCHGLFKKEDLFSHVKNCSENKKIEDKLQKIGKPVESLCELLSENCYDPSEELKNVLDKLKRDRATGAILRNRLILQFGEHMLGEAGHNANKHERIRQNLLDVAKLLLRAKKLTPMKTLEDFFYPPNFLHVVSAVRAVAGFKARKKTYTLPLLAHDLGYHLQIICSIIMRNADNARDDKLIESCKTFLSLYCKKWNRLICTRSRVNIGKIKRKKKRNRLLHAKTTVQQLEEKKLQTHVRVLHSSEQQVSTEHHGGVSSSSFGSSNPNPQQDHEVPTNTGVLHTSNKPRGNVDPDMTHSIKRKWNRVEVQAVEKHLMSFIKELRMPSTGDFNRCIDAEPHALKNRSFRVLRAYVRNRIKVLQKSTGSQRK